VWVSSQRGCATGQRAELAEPHEREHLCRGELGADAVVDDRDDFGLGEEEVDEEPFDVGGEDEAQCRAPVRQLQPLVLRGAGQGAVGRVVLVAELEEVPERRVPVDLLLRAFRW
jgi:hypothetical protein